MGERSEGSPLRPYDAVLARELDNASVPFNLPLSGHLTCVYHSMDRFVGGVWMDDGPQSASPTQMVRIAAALPGTEAVGEAPMRLRQRTNLAEMAQNVLSRVSNAWAHLKSAASRRCDLLTLGPPTGGRGWPVHRQAPPHRPARQAPTALARGVPCPPHQTYEPRVQLARGLRPPCGAVAGRHVAPATAYLGRTRVRTSVVLAPREPHGNGAAAGSAGHFIIRQERHPRGPFAAKP
jgi:hypothetical protein